MSSDALLPKITKIKDRIIYGAVPGLVIGSLLGVGTAPEDSSSLFRGLMMGLGGALAGYSVPGFAEATSGLAKAIKGENAGGIVGSFKDGFKEGIDSIRESSSGVQTGGTKTPTI